MPEILQDINWIDIFFIILLLGMVYKGLRAGVGGQILSLVGWLVLIFVSIRYYNLLSEAIFGFLLQRWARPMSFFVISATIFIIVKILERVFNVVSGGECAVVERMGGALVACLRAFMLFGILGMLFLLIPVDYMHLAVTRESRTCMFFVNLDAQIYSWMTGILGRSEKKQKQKEEVVEEFLTIAEKKHGRSR